MNPEIGAVAGAFMQHSPGQSHVGFLVVHQQQFNGFFIHGLTQLQVFLPPVCQLRRR
jgi:hypothetical protein